MKQEEVTVVVRLHLTDWQTILAGEGRKKPGRLCQSPVVMPIAISGKAAFAALPDIRNRSLIEFYYKLLAVKEGL